MRQRISAVTVAEPTSRRRSPRLLHLQNSTTPQPTTNKSVNGSSNLPKLGNGLKRITRLSGNIDGSKAPRLSEGKEIARVKRKRNQIGFQRTTQGWTKEQQVALHKAYFTTKPTPHLWRKVAKLVPGKTSQECFDKVHSDVQTPVCSKPASRTRKHNSPLVSGGKLFKTAEKSKSKRTCKTKSKSRKALRHLLQKYCHVNQNDLFSVLEPSVIPASEVTSRKSPQSSSKSYDRSPSACMRFSNKGESPLMSPPVLKKMNNTEGYVDRIRVRDHKRKVASLRCIKSAQNRKGGEPKSDTIEAAKNALIFFSKDVINKFQDSQANIVEANSE